MKLMVLRINKTASEVRMERRLSGVVIGVVFAGLPRSFSKSKAFLNRGLTNGHQTR